MNAILQAIENELAVRGDKPRHFRDYYLDAGPYPRGGYAKHMEFFAAGNHYRERLMLAANRVGKTEGVGLYEVVAHTTGAYPDWWNGRRFNRPVRCWVAGDTGKTVREILQRKLLGPFQNMGTGLLPADCILDTKRGSGVAESVEIVYVKHARGVSEIVFKSYDQRREGFQGTEQDIILLDEEPPLDVYTECLLRTMTNNGMLLLTFTPLMGLSNVVLMFCEGGRVDKAMPGKYVVSATWDDVPHLTEEAKKELWASIPPYQRDARSKGIPQLGSGAIYPVPESEIVIPAFDIPKHYPRVYGLDVGWNKTAAVWAARDLDTNTWYLYSEYYKGQAEPVVHATGIKTRGDWIPGVIDPAARGRGQADGGQLLEQYKDLGLDIFPADNTREAGIYEVWQMLSTGQLKVFSNLVNWLAEYRIYRRDDKGKVVKEHDHLMDACVVGSTRVMTRYGAVAIEKLIGINDYVYSVDGTLAKFAGARLTIKDAPTVQVTFDDGSTVRCTPDHPFLTENGWVQAQALMDATCYTGVPNSKGLPWNLSTLQKTGINSTGSTLNVDKTDTSKVGTACTYTEQCGRTTRGGPLRAWWYTIKMAIKATTTSKILNSCLWLATRTCTSTGINAEYLREQQPPLNIGTGQRMDAHGTSSTMPPPAPYSTKSVPLCASAVKKNIRLSTVESTNSAPVAAKPGIGGRMWLGALALRNILARCVTRNFKDYRGGRSPFAGPATVKCVKVEPAANENVYCLTVPGLHCFCLENGVVTHNTRYLIMTGRSRARVEQGRKGPALYRGETEQSGWMG